MCTVRAVVDRAGEEGLVRLKVGEKIPQVLHHHERVVIRFQHPVVVPRLLLHQPEHLLAGRHSPSKIYKIKFTKIDKQFLIKETKVS